MAGMAVGKKIRMEVEIVGECEVEVANPTDTEEVAQAVADLLGPNGLTFWRIDSVAAVEDHV
jgi:hypothetical protein